MQIMVIYKVFFSEIMRQIFTSELQWYCYWYKLLVFVYFYVHIWFHLNIM